MKVLVVGNGAREHALVWAFRKSPRVTELFAAPGNAGMEKLATCLPIDSSSIIELADFAAKLHVGLTVVGPELPLALGIVDEFRKRDLRIFGPTQKAAEIETSKVFAKRFMKQHGIPTAAFDVCATMEDAEEALARRGTTGFPVVVKADGLAGGKGVFLATDLEGALHACQKIMVDRVFGNAGERVIVEDCLTGTELSFQVLTDGRHALPLASAQDYKRLLDRDLGPNTGGMGAISPSKALTPELGHRIIKEIVNPAIAGLAEDGRAFNGVLYCGLMLTANGPVTLEFNARLGDPEAQAILPRLEGDALEPFLACTEGHLDQVRLEWKKEVSVAVVLASGGYPASIRTGYPVHGLDVVEKMPLQVFHGGTELVDGEIRTAAGRVLTVNACAPKRLRAVEQVYRGVGAISFQDMQFRHDIGRMARDETGVMRRPEGI